MIKFSVYIIVFLLLLFSCKEIYEPDTEFLENVVVVNGLITNEPGQHRIQINLTSKNETRPLNGAYVYVMDNEGNMTVFTEPFSGWYENGMYYSPETFAAEYEKTYQLFITTPEGKEYESKVQTMLQPIQIDSIFGKKNIKEYLSPTTSGGYVKLPVSGWDVHADLGYVDEENPRFRMDVTLLLLYDFSIVGATQTIYYCWKKVNLVDILNINTPRFDTENMGIRNHLVCFLPQNKTNYNLSEEEYIYKYLLILRQYRLNNDSYEYYKGIKEQLSAEGRLFDPIAAQLKGNIRSVNNPKELVLGFFEVSSTFSETYRLNSPSTIGQDHFSFTKTDDLEIISRTNCVEDIPPYFWYY
jgi:hypothetical protein